MAVFRAMPRLRTGLRAGLLGAQLHQDARQSAKSGELRAEDRRRPPQLRQKSSRAERRSRAQAEAQRESPFQRHAAWPLRQSRHLFPRAPRPLSPLHWMPLPRGLRDLGSRGLPTPHRTVSAASAGLPAKDPDALRDINADNQAQIQAIFSDILLAIVRTGVELQSPEWYTDKEGRLHIAEHVTAEGDVKTIMKVEAHPLLKPMIEILSRNNMTLGDMRMTPKVHEEEADIQGFIAARNVTEDTMTDFAARQTEALERLAGLIERSRDLQKRDPVLLEHQRDGDDA